MSKTNKDAGTPTVRSLRGLARRPFLLPISWGNWRHSKDGQLIFDHPTRGSEFYWINLNYVDTRAQMLEKIDHMRPKKWLSDEDFRQLLRALNDIFLHDLEPRHQLDVEALVKRRFQVATTDLNGHIDDQASLMGPEAD